MCYSAYVVGGIIVMALRDVIIAQADNDNSSFEANNSIVKSRTAAVDFTNSPKVAGREGFIWIKEFDMPGGYAQVLNTGVPDVIDVPVLVYQHPKAPYIRQARGVDHAELISYDWDVTYIGNGDSGPHNVMHEWPDWTPSSDVVNVYPRAIVSLRTYPSSSLEVFVDYYRYTKDADFVVFAGGTIDIASYVDSSPLSVAFVLVYLDLDTNTLGAVSSIVAVADIVGDQSNYWPDMPSNTIPSSVISVVSQSAVSETMITDVRDMLGSVQQSNISSAVDVLALSIYELDEQISYAAVQAGPPERVKFTGTYAGGVFNTGVYTGIWNNNLITIAQDSDGGFPANVGWYTVQRGGDYQIKAYIDIDPTTTPGVVSEQVKISMDVSIGGVQIGYPVYGVIDVSTSTLQLDLGTYLPLLVRNNSITVDVIHNGVLNAALTLNYTLSISIVGVDHSGGV